MRILRVLPVGNGACSLIRQSRDYWQAGSADTVSIIDCGRGSRGGQKAAAYLEAELSSRDWDALQSVVVTHWDADHWNGLRYLADSTPRQVPEKKRKLMLYSPAIPIGIPPRTQAGVSAFISATSGSGVEAIDFVRAWRKHFDVERIPVAKGDTIELAERPYIVEWPPRELSGKVVNEALSVLAAIEDIAASNTPFQAALNEAYSRIEDGAFGPSEGSEDAEGEEWGELLDGSGSDEEVFAETTDPLDADKKTDDPIAGVVVGGNSSGIPILDKERHGPLIRSARRLQNLLSLVFHDREDRSLIVYGDAPEKVVELLAPSLHRTYTVQLAPHHGTHAMPWNAPSSIFCIAQ